MPKFTIETTYDLPVYRHTTYEAENLEAALAMATADDDWSGQKEDIESGHDTRITGAWAGEEAYRGDQLPVPAEAPLSAMPLGLSPLPWKYVNSNGRPAHGMADWIEDAHGNIVVDNVGHIDGPFIVTRANGAGPAGEPYGYVYRLRYGPDHWSHQFMFSDAGIFKALPAANVKEVVPLYAGAAPSADQSMQASLRNAYAAIESLLEQVQQMRGIFTDEDGAIQRAVNDGDDAIEDIGKALARLT